MDYVKVPDEITINEIAGDDSCLSPSKYVRFIPPEIHTASDFVTLDKLVVTRSERVNVEKNNNYKYAEIGDINVFNGDISFRSIKGWQLPTKRPAVAKKGDVLVSTVRTYRMGIGYVTDTTSNLVTTNAVLNLRGIKSPFFKNIAYSRIGKVEWY